MHEKMTTLHASDHQSENERQLKKFNYSEQKHTAFPPQFVFRGRFTF